MANLFTKRFQKIWTGVLTVALLMPFGVGAVGVNGKNAAYASAGTPELIVHYHRTDGNYNPWFLWIWPSAPQSLGGNNYYFNAPQDPYGVVCNAQVSGSNTQLGFLVRDANFDKDVMQDRYVDMTQHLVNGKVEIWLVQGDSNIYYAKSDAERADGFTDQTTFAPFTTPNALQWTSWPNPPASTKAINVYYNGPVSQGATSVTLHWGLNAWESVTDTPMTQLANGFWEATVNVPAGAQLKYDYYNQAGTWDNNSGSDYVSNPY